ncbi:hypothetical protein E4O98_09650 [Pseudomonas sp. W2Jun17]|uniref:Uncharacterized protein n=1 Tax=Pseudomonas synxantha TaxID=47883 RepID=A0A5D3GAP6_9PSED|nr:hypothetical protein [Pseudomonas sp. W2Jun17]TYK57541.1 hypothetical protein FXO26_13625 [Pseudomonas synxantha]
MGRLGRLHEEVLPLIIFFAGNDFLFFLWEPGLPAMQTPRCVSKTEVMLSQASQLPHKASATGCCVLRADIAGLHHGVELLRIATLLARTVG